MTNTDTPFTATNGARISPHTTGSAVVTTPTGAQYFLSANAMTGIKEYFTDTIRQESDAARGVHRDPEAPHMVVYDKDASGQPMTDGLGKRVVRVLNENTGATVIVAEGSLDYTPSEYRRVAKRWLDTNPATPLPKPGEVWLVDGEPCLVTRWGNLRSSTGALTPFPAVMGGATRIYPQED